MRSNPPSGTKRTQNGQRVVAHRFCVRSNPFTGTKRTQNGQQRRVSLLPGSGPTGPTVPPIIESQPTARPAVHRGADPPDPGTNPINRILHLARDQFGVVARHQLLDELGLSTSAIGRLTGRRTLLPLGAGVYRVASAPDTFLARAIAAQLWAGDDGFLSSWTAARIYGLRKMPTSPIHLTLPSTTARRPPDWIHLDRTRWYDGDRDRTRHATGLVVAVPLRMMFGVARDFNHHRFARAAEDAWHLGLVDPDCLAEYLDAHRCRGKNGVRNLERWLDKVADRRRPSQSDLEREFIEAFERVGLPPASLQHPLRLRNGEIIHLDIAWPDIGLAVEPGSSWFHGGDDGQHRDHDRDLACRELGWDVIRLDEQFRFDPAGAAHRVKRAFLERARMFAASGAGPAAGTPRGRAG